MSRRITQDDLDAEIRSHLAGVRAPEPASLGEVLRRLPERARARRRWSPTIPAMVGSAALAIILIAAVAIVGLPFIGSRAGPASPAATPGPLASAAAGDLGQVRAAIESEYAGQLLEIGDGAGTVVVGLRSTEAAAAADLVARYGAMVQVTVGLFPYPAPSGGTNVCTGRVGPLVDPGPLRATIKMPSHSVGHEVAFAATVRLTNTGPVPLAVETGQPLLIFLFEPGGTVPVGVAAGGIAGTGLGFRLEPGGSSSIPATGGTSSCDLRLGYELPDGQYDARAAVEIDEASSGGVNGVFLSDPFSITVTTK